MNDRDNTSSAANDPAPMLFDLPPLAAQERMIEALLFAASEPMSLTALENRLPPGAQVKTALQELQRRYQGRGVELRKIGDGYGFRTASDLGYLMLHEQVEQRKLSRAAIETLAIIAYHQPTTRAEIEEIRGVGISRGTIDQLMELEWIKFGRRKMTPGRPVTFMTTNAFLDHFGLASTKDLPGLSELRQAGLLGDLSLRGTIDEEKNPEEQASLFDETSDQKPA